MHDLPCPLDAVGLAGDLETCPLKQPHRKAAETGVVIDDEDIRRHGSDDCNDHNCDR